MEEPIIVELGLTARQMNSLMWILECWLKQYEDTESSDYKVDALSMLTALESVGE